MQQQNFGKILGILRQHETCEAKNLETLFNYKIGDLEELDKESKRIILDFHKVDAGQAISAYEKKKQKRKEFLEKTKKKNTQQIDLIEK